MIHRDLQTLCKPNFRCPPKQFLRLGNIRAALLRIVLWQRLENNLRRILEMFANFLRELQNRDLFRIPDVGRQVFVRHRQLVDAVDQIRNIAKAARLLPFPINRDRLARQRLVHKVRQRAAVVQSHPRPIRVENSHDMRVDAEVAVIRHRHRFAKPLCFVINSARPDRVDVAPIALRLRRNIRVAITFACRRDKKLRFLRPRQIERVLRSHRTHPHRLDRKFQIIEQGSRAMQNAKRNRPRHQSKSARKHRHRCGF